MSGAPRVPPVLVPAGAPSRLPPRFWAGVGKGGERLSGPHRLKGPRTASGLGDGSGRRPPTAVGARGGRARGGGASGMGRGRLFSADSRNKSWTRGEGSPVSAWRQPTLCIGERPPPLERPPARASPPPASTPRACSAAPGVGTEGRADGVKPGAMHGHLLGCHLFARLLCLLPLPHLSPPLSPPPPSPE